MDEYFREQLDRAKEELRGYADKAAQRIIAESVSDGTIGAKPTPAKDEYIRELKEHAERLKVESAEPTKRITRECHWKFPTEPVCPGCGRCNHCGRPMEARPPLGDTGTFPAPYTVTWTMADGSAAIQTSIFPPAS